MPERLDQPIDADRDRYAAPLLSDPVQGTEIDFEQHRHDHQPDQNGDRYVDFGQGQPAKRLKWRGYQLTEDYAGDDTEGHPDGQVTLETPESRSGAARRSISNRTHDFSWSGSSTNFVCASIELRLIRRFSSFDSGGKDVILYA
jgi:hypothetical protein